MDAGKAYWANRHLENLKRLIMSDRGAHVLGDRRRKSGCKEYCRVVESVQEELRKLFIGDPGYGEFMRDERLVHGAEITFLEDAMNLLTSAMECLRHDGDAAYRERAMPALDGLWGRFQAMLERFRLEEMGARRQIRVERLAARPDEDPEFSERDCDNFDAPENV